MHKRLRPVMRHRHSNHFTCTAVQETGGKVTRTVPVSASEHIPRVTERFYRVDKSRSRETGGTGLGLAIVKHVLFRHQAQLQIESELGKGSTFKIIISKARLAPPINSKDLLSGTVPESSPVIGV